MDRDKLLELIEANASDDELYALYITLMESKGINPTVPDDIEGYPEYEDDRFEPDVKGTEVIFRYPSMEQEGFGNTRLCPLCGSKAIIKYGHKNHKQRYKCNQCHKIIVPTTNTIMAHSRQSYDKWQVAIHDTLNYVPVEDTAEQLEVSKPTAFYMRHKILMAIQDLQQADPSILSEVSELDETYVLESFKGSPIPGEKRPARRRGGSASKRGLSDEQVCVCSGVQRNQGPAMFSVVNRAAPSKDEILEAFEGRIDPDALILVDGAKSYSVLEDTTHCKVVNAKKEEGHFYHLNNVNSLHSYFKDVYHGYRGFATKYSNRYGSMFGMNYRHPKDLEQRLLDIICGPTGSADYSHTVKDTKESGLTQV